MVRLACTSSKTEILNKINFNPDMSNKVFFHPKKSWSENDNQWFKLWFDILLQTQQIVCATVDSHCLEYLGYITLLGTPQCIQPAGYSCVVYHFELMW